MIPQRLRLCGDSHLYKVVALLELDASFTRHHFYVSHTNLERDTLSWLAQVALLYNPITDVCNPTISPLYLVDPSCSWQHTFTADGL